MQNLFSSQHIVCEVKHFYFDKRIWKASDQKSKKVPNTSDLTESAFKIPVSI